MTVVTNTVSESMAQAVQAHYAGDLTAARTAYSLVLLHDAQHAQAHHNLGVLDMQEGRVKDGIGRFHKALTFNGRELQYWLSYMQALMAGGHHEQAHTVLAKALAAGMSGPQVKAFELEINRVLQSSIPKSGELQAVLRRHLSAGDTLVAQGQHALALQAFQKAAQLDGKLANVFARIGDAHCALYEYDAAELNYEHAMRLDPSDSELLVGYAISQFWQGKLTNAEQSLHQVVQKHPQHARALTLLAGVYEKLGQLDRVSAFYERALAVQPEDALTNSNYLFFLAYQSQLPPEDYLSQAKLWALRTLQPGQRQWAKEQAKRRKWQLLNRVGRRLRVGYVSGDFRQHAVATFIERLFAQHDTNRIELFAYCANTYSDDVTQRIRQLVDYWHSVGHLTDEALHALIETHEIDVLIDLSGHTAHNRLGVFARRAAPVQATYLGYFASTGLSEMDFWIADEVLVPSDHTSHFVESVWRLPRLWASYNGRSDAPAVIERNTVLRPMTIGCFNNLSKISLESLNLWALILRELVGAKLILKAEALDDLANRKRVADVLLAHGVAAHRFELIGSATSWFDYMALFNQLDVALDPVGSHSGVTTTCDALWMGVPVVTLAGNRLSQRHSASLLAALGRDSWVAESHAQYVKSVISLAQNCESHHRAVQREHMRQSTLCDAKGLAVALENAFETMFDQRVQCNFLAAP